MSGKILVEITKKGAGQIHTGQGTTYQKGEILEVGVHIPQSAYEGLIDAGWINDARNGDKVTFVPAPEGFTENDRLAGVVTSDLAASRAADLQRKAAELAEIPDELLAKARELMAAEAAKAAKSAGAK